MYDPEVCIECGGRSLRESELRSEGHFCTKLKECRECGFSWDEIFQFQGVEFFDPETGSYEQKDKSEF